MTILTPIFDQGVKCSIQLSLSTSNFLLKPKADQAGTSSSCPPNEGYYKVYLSRLNLSPLNPWEPRVEVYSGHEDQVTIDIPSGMNLEKYIFTHSSVLFISNMAPSLNFDV